MKLQLDIVNKTIKLDESVNLGNFAEVLYKILPNDWKDYKLEINLIINWQTPIYVDRWVNPTWYPWWGSITSISAGTGGSINSADFTVTNDQGNGNFTITGITNCDGIKVSDSNGIYNLEVN